MTGYQLSAEEEQILRLALPIILRLVADTGDELDDRVLDVLRQHGGWMIATEIANGGSGGGGVRREKVEGSLGRLAAVGAVLVRVGAPGRRSTAKCNRAAGDRLGQAPELVVEVDLEPEPVEQPGPHVNREEAEQ